ncbi:ribonuclease Y [Telmatocola sphagniphila]|uniref:Ribonuclease Y n=1 Tax=Telmatocola sphagniphila TaxID=1123043 RepID=A0A8E6BCY4_9BACT|nr:ribonuclease Y [Telmatocola sphagniphila]
MDFPSIGLAGLLALIVGVTVGHFFTKKKMSGIATQQENLGLVARQKAEEEAQEIRGRADQDANRIRKEAELRVKDEYFQKRDEFNRETEKMRTDLRDLERKLEKKEDNLEQRQTQIQKKERDLEKSQKKLAEKQEVLDKQSNDLEVTLTEQKKLLSQITGMSREDAEKLLMARVEEELSGEIGERIRKHEEGLKSITDQKSREILASAIQRYAAQHTAETTVSTVDIPSDDVKGRIIGREGRNIRTFEKVTGVDVIVDDTPGVVIVSAFDNIRRETARLALAKLIQDGRIHPTRIEEVVLETQQEMEKHINEIGRKAVVDADVGHVHEKLVHLLGRLKFRTSYSQNVLQHSLEVCHLSGMMAAELGLDSKLARRCALLHDIGKAADHEMEGGHPKIGAELAKRYGETNKDVLHAIIGHHDDITVDHIYTVIVAAADAISASRPGARRETLEKYVKRLEQLEAIACGFPGIEQAFAIQAGRELRVVANANQINDADSLRICREIAKSIEEQLDYPGEIKVTVVREQRFIEIAR